MIPAEVRIEVSIPALTVASSQVRATDGATSRLSSLAIGQNRSKEALFGWLVLIADGAAISASLALAWSLFTSFRVRSSSIPAFISYYGWVGGLFIPIWVLMARNAGLFRSQSYFPANKLFFALCRAFSPAILCVWAALVWRDRSNDTVLFLALFTPITALLLGTNKFTFRSALTRLAKQRNSNAIQRILLIANPEQTGDYSEFCRSLNHWGIELVADRETRTRLYELLREDSYPSASWDLTLSRWIIDEVILISDWSLAGKFEALASACAQRGITFRVLIQVPRPSIGRYFVEDAGEGHHLVSLEVTKQQMLPLILKRTLDIAIAIPGLMICVIVGSWYYFKLRQESPGNLLFRQQRVGLNGRRFTLYKFRTMYPDAEARISQLAALNQMRGSMFKIKNDPRILPCGHGLRKRHLDELPQFWNVLKGDMSVIGTRPPTEGEVAEYKPHHYRRLSMKPGITGLWQISGNAETKDFEDVVRLDCTYIDSWSVLSDLRILARTITKVTTGGGW